MLIKFKVGNFRSFKDVNEFSLIKGKQRYHEERIGDVDNLKILKFSAMFGANASGKSNFVKALRVMQYIVLNNVVPLDAVNEYFKLDDASKHKPTYFEVFFSVGSSIFSYGFEINLCTRVVESEWLFKLHKRNDNTVHENMLFERVNGVTRFKNEKNVNPRLTIYSEDAKLSPNNLLLWLVSKNSIAFKGTDDEVVSAIISTYLWFQSSLRVLYTGEPIFGQEFINEINEKEFSELLDQFDTGIKSVRTMPSDESEFKRQLNPPQLDLNVLQQTLMVQQQFNPKTSPSALIKTLYDFWIIQLRDNKLSFARLEFFHDKEEKEVFRISNESEGTLRLFELIDVLIDKNTDRVLVVDELDRCLHPMLTIQFVKLFLAKAANGQDRCQLVVTTHESHLLDLDILRRDEIWFAKKENNESKLFSLEEYNVRFDKVIDKAYFEGRYGGVPVFDSVFFREYVNYENKE